MTVRRVKDPKGVIVLFKTHLRDGADVAAYERTSRRMHELVAGIPGFISIKGYTSEDGDAIDIVRFESEESLERWRAQPEHRDAQRRGRDEFYDFYRVEACRVVREYEFRLEDLEAMTRTAEMGGDRKRPRP